MRSVSPTFVGGAVMFVLGVGLAAGIRAGTGDERRPSGPVISSPHRPRPYGFDIQVLVGGRPLPQATADGGRRVEAVVGMEYELRLTNPTPDRVAVAVSVDGLNVIDARHTTAWDASKWVIHPHGTLILSGWQVGSERARRFYFTTERDAYATRLGRPGDLGVISAVFYSASGIASRRSSRTAWPCPRGGTPSASRERPPRDWPPGRPPVKMMTRRGGDGRLTGPTTAAGRRRGSAGPYAVRSGRSAWSSSGTRSPS
jgi:hypothetical protein